MLSVRDERITSKVQITNRSFLVGVNNKKVETDCTATTGGQGKQTYFMAFGGGSTVKL
jgi:hypothetical protein